MRTSDSVSITALTFANSMLTLLDIAGSNFAEEKYKHCVFCQYAIQELCTFMGYICIAKLMILCSPQGVGMDEREGYLRKHLLETGIVKMTL